jgi:L-rhamnose mutarotase
VSRHGSIIGLKAEKVAEYKQLHAAAWPDILTKISECNIRNYSIFLRKMPDGRHYLFSYFEYVGENFVADMQKMADDPRTQEWWAVCKPCQEPLTDRVEGEWWAEAEEVFHWD